MPAPVSAGRSFIPGLRSEMLSTYKRQHSGSREKLGRVMRMGIPSTKRTEFYFFWQSAPHMVRWPYGQPMSEKGFKGIRFNVTNVRWGRAISWQADDRSDDQTQSLLQQARDLGTSAGLLDERVFFQILQGSTDGDLLAAAGSDPGNEDSTGGIPNAPDGQSLFSTTRDGSNARFGATSGNLLTGSQLTADAGVLTEDDMRGDYFTAREQFAKYQDTEGQPLFDQSVIESEAVLIFGVANWSTFAQAFRRSQIPVSSAGVSNEVQAEGITPIPFATQRITTNDMYVGLGGVQQRAVFSQEREPISEVLATKENSDRARETDEESIRFKLRRGYGVAEPYALVKVDELT